MYVRAEGMINGIMVYWKEAPEAAVYRVRLFIQDRHRHDVMKDGRIQSCEDKSEFIEIATIEEPRNVRYHTFSGLATIDQQEPVDHSLLRPIATGRDYYVSVQAENRSGEIVDESERIVVYLDKLYGDRIRHYGR